MRRKNGSEGLSVLSQSRAKSCVDISIATPDNDFEHPRLTNIQLIKCVIPRWIFTSFDGDM